MHNIKRISAALLVLFATQGNFAHAAQDLLLHINEGVAEQTSVSELQDKYKGLKDFIAKVLNKRLQYESSQSLQGSQRNLEKQRFDLAYVRPSNISATALRDYGYVLVAAVKGDFSANFVVAKDSAVKSAADLKGKRFAMPDQKSLMTKVGQATLRDMGADPTPETVRYSRLQESVLMQLEQDQADVGVVAPMLAKEWVEKGGRVVHTSKKLPFWSIIAAPSVSPADISKLRAALLGMEYSNEGKNILKTIGVKGFVGGNTKDYTDMLAWIGT